MLVRLDHALLRVPARQELLQFLRHPFSDENCRRVEEKLPSIALVYRAMASAMATWETVELPSLTNDPTTAFMPVAGIGSQDLPLAPRVLLQVQVELLHEDLRDHQERLGSRSGRAMTGHGTPAHTALALQAFSLHEAAFLTFAGFFRIHQSGWLIEFSLTPLGKECLRNRVRSATTQNFTEGAMRVALQANIKNALARGLPPSGRIADALEPRQLDALEDKLLDTYFSLSSRMQCDSAVAPLIARARHLCRWMALLEMVRLADEQAFQPHVELLARLKLDPALPNVVITERIKALSSDKGIRQTPSGGLTLGEASLGHAIACCKGAVLSESEAGALGKSFEAHVKSYVKECVPSEDYVVREGFKAAQKHHGLNYDCDLILFEPKRQKIYFVQTKWKRDARTANLDDELTEWRAKNSSLTHGFSQLHGLRERLSEKSVLDQVKGQLKDIRLTDQQILENSHFVIVHTLPYFNAYLNEGIAIYEWNFFRNILLRGAIQCAQAPVGDWGKLRQLATVSHVEPLPLEDPERALDHFYQAIGADLNAIPRQMEARMQARYGFDVELQVGWWGRLFGRGVARVVRPYL